MTDGEASVPPVRREASRTLRLEVEVRADRAEVVCATLWAHGAVGVWERPGEVVAWFAATDDAATLDLEGMGDLAELSPQRQRWSVEPERDWQEAWKATIGPVHAGRVCVVPSWLAGAHEPAEGELTLVLDPGQAFGSGHHATTALCLELIDAIEAEDGLAGRTVADIGCGTGVLAIAAAAWGAEVVAVDIDPEAVEVTRRNATANGVHLTAVVGSARDLAQPADVVVANLVTDLLVAMADQLVAATRGTLVVSGIATERRARALDALGAAGARLVEVVERDGWVAAHLEVGEETW